VYFSILLNKRLNYKQVLLKPFLLNVVICDQNIRETALTNFLEHCRGFEDPLYFSNVKKETQKNEKNVHTFIFQRGRYCHQSNHCFFLFDGKTYDGKNNGGPTDVEFLNTPIKKIF
jgi:hypothetical protein